MGLDRDQGYELAQRCGRSLTILKRLIPSGAPAQPEWTPQAIALKPAFLAGGWSSNTEMDCTLLKELGGFQNYADLDTVLMPTLSLSDRPIDKVAEVWQVRAPVDAFYFYGHQITDTDLDRFRDAILKVFSHASTQPSRDEKFSLSYKTPADYSNWLRDGLALTLVIIAAMHNVAGLHINGKTPQQFVDDVVAALPHWGKNHKSIIRLGNQAALFAEAAPNPFLKALESMVEGYPDELAQIFVKESGHPFGPSSPHIYFLWALETIAWDPRYLNRAVLVLAKLAELDPEPESNHVNRPINSLRAILLGWSPNTYALQAQRITCVDLVLNNCPNVGWQLLVKLLPRHHDSTSPTQHPKIRDLAPQVSEEITFGLVWDFETAIVNRAVVEAGNDEDRIVPLINAFGAFQPSNRASVIAMADNYLKSFQTFEGCKVWHALKEGAARHDYFADSDWAMTADERELITEVVERHSPSDPLVQDRRAFDDWMPHIGKYQPGNDDSPDPDEIRKDVLERVLTRDGVAGILRLARMVKLPNLIGPALRGTSISLQQLFELLEGSLAHDGTSREFAFYVSAVGAERFGKEWKEAFGQKILANIQDDTTKAYLLLGWPQDEDTWSLVDSLGRQVSDQYWTQIQVLPIHGTDEQLMFAIDKLRECNRDFDVLGLVHTRMKDLPTALISGILKRGVSQVERTAKRMGTMFSYHLERALAELRDRSDIEESEIAQIEYSYLPVFRFEAQPHSLIKLLSQDPQLYVDVLSHVFRGRSAEPQEVINDEAKARARASFDLLMKFKSVPGLNGLKVDFDVLANWVSQVRDIAEKKDLKDICDNYIGQLLAHSPLDPEGSVWPASAVCKVIEITASTKLEQGFAVECLNKRGVYSKALDEGGDQERVLANQYQQWADNISHYPRTSATLAGVADDWRRRAADEDTRAEQGKLKG